MLPNVTNPDDEVTRWALRARSGDRDALERFVRATQRQVWELGAHLADVGSADDLTRETYARAVAGLRRFSGRTPARTWLLAIARRVVLDRRGEPVSDRHEALVLTQVLGLSYAEAAEVVGCVVEEVRSRVARARADLVRAARESGSTESGTTEVG
ncbi:sigma factor-like helix-turn-helix DNA-binding protein [Actinosynnema sp. NPDC004786]